MPGVMLLPALLACNTDSGLSTHNDPPQVALASPADASAWPAGTPLVFVAAVSDDSTALAELAITFASDPQGGLEGELELLDGRVRFTSEPLDVSIHTITMRVTDADAAVGEDSLNLEVLPNTPPTVSITSPAAGSALEEGSDITVEVQVTDTTEEDLTDLVLTWVVDGEPLPDPDSPDADGISALRIVGAELGSHTVQVTVTDTPGDSATDTTEVELIPADQDGDGFISDRLGGDDCDDDDGAIHPDADEVCDDADTDEDCDGLADDADDSVTDPVAAYPDADGDGFGDPDALYWTCEPESGVDDDRDCNDADAAVNPDATEVCDDGLDNDCDGAWAGCRYSGELDPYSGDAMVYGPGDYAKSGTALSATDTDGDGLGDLVLGVPQDSSAGTYAGALRIVLGPHLGETVLGGSEPAWTGELDRALAGAAVAVLGDIDGDGWDDLAVGAPDDDSAGTLAGRAYLLHGPVTTSGSLGSLDHWSGSAGAELGTHLASAGDVDGDGLADVVIGAPQDSSLYSDGGAAYLLLGPASTGGSVDDQYDARFRPEDTKDELGTTVASAGDVDGDGLDDLLLGAPKRNDLETDSGVVYLVLGHATRFNGVSLRLNGADARLRGHERDGRLGTALVGAGDLDGDGFGEVLLGAESQSGPGAAYLLRGPLVGDVATDLADVRFEGDINGAHHGAAAALGDIDGDGEVDLALGAPEHSSGTARGRVSLLHGPLLALAPSVDLTTGADATWGGPGNNDRVGQAVGLHDLDGDGKDELILGAIGDDSEGADAGAVFVFEGRGL